MIKCRTQVIPIFIGNKLQKTLETLISKDFSDPDILTDASFLKNELERALEGLRYDLFF